MTIGKGAPYGRPGALPDGAVVVASDAEARAVVTDARRAGGAVPALGLLGGDLCRTLGGLGDEQRLRRGHGTVVPVDLGTVLLDGRLEFFVAHLAAHRWDWGGPVVVAMNAEWLGEWDLGPRAHPNDGLLDVTEGSLGFRDRLAARRKARSASHLPHPRLRATRVSAGTYSFDKGVTIRLDGETAGRARQIVLRVEPDALTVVV
ncbi:MAG TPA: hypothetical protein VIY72_08690 [Acidimicrobiales bacterium]